MNRNLSSGPPPKPKEESQAVGEFLEWLGTKAEREKREILAYLQETA